MIMIAVALLLSMVLCLLFGVPYIDFLRKKTIGQYILDVAKKDNRIKIINQENKGVAVARNAGLDIATGEYITFVDSDDWLELLQLVCYAGQLGCAVNLTDAKNEIHC